MSDVTAGACVMGLYTSSVYLLSLPGGWIADRFLGQRRAVTYGGIGIMLGNVLLALPSTACSTRASRHRDRHRPPQAEHLDDRRPALPPATIRAADAGFTIYYMGINIGAFSRRSSVASSPSVSTGTSGSRQPALGWCLASFNTCSASVTWVTPGSSRRPPRPRRLPRRCGGGRRSGAASASSYAWPSAWGLRAGVLPITPTQIADAAGYFLLITTVVFFGWLFFGGDWTPIERKRLYVIGVFFLAAALFWSEFEQAGSTLNLFADRSTRTSILGWNFPSSWFQSFNALFIIMFAPVFAWLWVRMGDREPSSPIKFGIGLIGVGAGFALLVPAARAAESGGLVSPLWLTATYLIHTFAELCLSPVGLSSMTKLAPARVAGLMMGVWFLGAAVGNFIGGRLASFYEAWPLPNLFGVVAAFGIVLGIVLLALSRPIKAWMGRS